MSKKAFAPPVVKSYRTPFGKGELELHGKPEDGITVKSVTISPVQSQRQKGSTSNVEKKSECKKNLEMIENRKGFLTDAQFEEIVQSILQKSPQECTENLQERLVPAESAEGQRSRREMSEAFLPAERSDWRKKTEVALSEVGWKEHQIKVKKQSKSGVNQGEKKLNEKAAANNVGCKENRKGEPKKAAQGDAQDVTDPEEAPEEEEEDGGSGSSRCCTAWVQCSYPSCEKWRRLSGDVDPSALPEDWSCSQNPDLQYNSCSVPEETWSGSEDEVVYAIYFPGSIVWAKQYGYPWWPGIIEADPDIGEYFLFSSQADSLPSKYHVTFFGHSVTRAWISASLLKNYGEPPGEGNAVAKLRNRSEKENLKAALEMAKEAEQISIQARIKRFGFHSRFQHKESPKDCKILKEQNNTASRPRVKRAPGTKGGNRSTATSSKDQEKLLREISGVKPNENIKRPVDTKGDKKPELGGLENASPALKRRERTAPKAAARATRKQDSGQKGLKKSFSLPPPCQASQARHPLRSWPDSSPAGFAFSPPRSQKDRSNRSGGSLGPKGT